jgi:hypothetical protein
VVYTCKGGSKATGFIKCGVREIRKFRKIAGGIVLCSKMLHS